MACPGCANPALVKVERDVHWCGRCGTIVMTSGVWILPTEFRKVRTKVGTAMEILDTDGLTEREQALRLLLSPDVHLGGDADEI